MDFTPEMRPEMHPRHRPSILILLNRTPELSYLVHGGRCRHSVVGALLQLLHRRLQCPHLQLSQAGDADALDRVLPEQRIGI